MSETETETGLILLGSETGGKRTLRWPIPSMSSDGVRSEDVMGVVESPTPPGPHSAHTTVFTHHSLHNTVLLLVTYTSYS